MDASTPQPVEEKKESGIGPMAAAIIVVILFAIGGAYFFIQGSKRFHTPPVQENLNA